MDNQEKMRVASQERSSMNGSNKRPGAERIVQIFEKQDGSKVGSLMNKVRWHEYPVSCNGYSIADRLFRKNEKILAFMGQIS